LREWSFLTNHAAVLLAVARHPEARLRDLADDAGITERGAHRIVSDLVDAGCITRVRVGRRNRYELRVDSSTGAGEPLAELRAILDLFGTIEPVAPIDLRDSASAALAVEPDPVA